MSTIRNTCEAMADTARQEGRTRPSFVLRWVTMLAWLSTSCGGVLAAGIQVPLTIGTTNAIVDEFGEQLPGTSPDSVYFDLPYVEGDMVQVIQTYDGRIERPGLDGLPTGTNNVVVATVRIGCGTDPFAGEIGQFGLSLVTYAGGRLFCRVFNATELSGATFYGDSQIYVPTTSYSIFIPQITVNRPLDPAVSDASGLNNSWIRRLGGVPTNFPCLGRSPGLAYATFINGLNPSVPGSYLGVAHVQPGPGETSTIYWYSIIGQRYQIERVTNLASGCASVIGPAITATEWVSHTTDTNCSASSAMYRVKRITPL